MRYDLATLTRRAKNPRRSFIAIRDIRPPSTFAGDLYRDAYSPVVALWQAAVPDILAEYERAILQQLRDQSITQDTASDIQANIESVERGFNILALTITPRIERWALRFERWHRRKWRDAVLSSASVDIGTLIGASDVRQTLDAAINYNVSLVKDISAEAQRKISALVFDGLRNARPARDVAKDLRNVTDLGRARSIRIASDQLAKVASSLADERRRDAGISAWQWLHSGKRIPRANHVARDGLYYSDDPTQVGTDIDGKTVRAPPDDRPGQLPYCGCRSQSVLVF